VTIDRDLWQRARPLFDEIVDLDADARRARLEAIGHSEPSMRETLERLLRADGFADEKLRGFDFVAGPPSKSSPSVDLDPLGIVGRTVSHFNVTDFVAAGGMGVVYKAADVTLGRVVAVKFPLPHQRMDDEAKERFIHEARSVAALDHPNLCTVYEFGESAHGLYLAMPFYQGETLKDRIARERVLPARDAVSIARQVAAGLQSAHAAGIVHRDLKPGNVMILPDGSVKILDFGIAKVHDVQLTRTGVALGTIAYMAPGQATGERAGAQADLWAMGVMLYEMLTGVLPFRGPNEMAVLHAILHHDPEPPSRINRDVPPALDAVVAGLLQKDASRRYPSAAALMSDLDAAMTGAPVAHKPPVVKRFDGPSIRRIALRAAAVLAVAAVALIGRQMLHASGASASAMERSVAVLPFVDREGNDATAYLAPGVADEVISLLGGVSGWKVSALSSAEQLRRRGLTPRAIGEKLGVRYLVDGPVRIASDTFYLAARLTRVSDDAPFWTHDFKAPLARLVTLEREVADSVLHALQSGGRVVSSGPPPTTDPVAYELYLKARSAWRLRTEASLKEALADYDGALQRDHRFAAAYSGIADVYVNLSNFGWGSMTAREAIRHAEIAALQALALDSSSAEAYAALGFVQMSHLEYAKADASLRRAIELNPNWSWAHQRYALLFQMEGRTSDSRDASLRALALDPLSVPAMSHLGVTYLAENRLKEAREKLDSAFQVSATFPVTLQYLGAIDAAERNYPEAVKKLEQAHKWAGAFPGIPGALAYAYGKIGRSADAARVMDSTRKAISDDRSRVNYALALAIVGQTDSALTDSAFKMLRGAEWDIPTVIEVRSDPLLRQFRSDPQYQELLARIGLKR
jgi:serine/threonine-protein kinase